MDFQLPLRAYSTYILGNPVWRQSEVYSCLYSSHEAFVLPIMRVGNQAELTAEMVIHLPGLKNLENPGVLVVSKVLVCLDCGSSHFTVPKKELASIAENTREDKSSTLKSSAFDVPLSGGSASQVKSKLAVPDRLLTNVLPERTAFTAAKRSTGALSFAT